MKLLTAAQKSAFEARVAAGLNPAEACGVCGSGKVTLEEAAQYCEDCLDFEANGTEVYCRSCRVRYRVLRRLGCQKDGEERGRAHQKVAEFRAVRASGPEALREYFAAERVR